MIPNVVNGVPVPAATETMPPLPVLPSLVAVLSAYMYSLPPIVAAYTPVIAAVLIAVATPSTVLLGLTGTVITVSFTVNVFPAVKDTGANVPDTVGHAVFQSSLPTNTQVLYKSDNAVSLVCAAVGPPRL